MSDCTLYPSDDLLPDESIEPCMSVSAGVIVADGSHIIIADDEELMEILAHVIPAIV